MSKNQSDSASLRVVLIDCYVNERSFIRDTTFRSLANELESENTHAKLIEVVRDEPGAGKAIEDAEAVLHGNRPELVVVSRAWSEQLVEAIRLASGPQARIVRYSHGAPSPVDASFDSMVDLEGIQSLLEGIENISTPQWRFTRDELRTPVPTPTSSGDARPTISGPAKGCPFLADVRTSPAYRDADIDFDKVQTKGCSFCLDNIGAFAAFPPEVTVETWLSQLRTLRAERPDLREVLLTDERPHPNLPALMAAILADTALHGIELLIKTRVDWLEEFADTALREACDLAEKSGSVLHIYLVGFESFHQADLDLFNKAVTVADNVRAITTLKRLEERHPRSFEFRKHRAHGIVLFHPWTTPESLLDNARVMREVGFHELRSQTLKTRLRLYASVPLHALAERADLLVEHFDDGRSDRAIEQGYDASVPWKFANPLAETVFRAANHVAEAMPALSEPDVLEIVTHFVMRWPAFATEPDLAAFPILHALFCWGGWPGDVVEYGGTTVAGFDREVEAVAAGDKQACLKESVPSEETDSLIRAYQTMGLAATVVSTHQRGRADGRHQRGDTHAIVAVAQNNETLAAVVEHQQAVERGERSHIQAMGELMGYPSCCTDAFTALGSHGDNMSLEKAPFLAHPELPLDPLVNRFAALSLTSHTLCTPKCEPSVALAAKRLAAIREVDSEAAARIADHLTSPVLRLDYRRAAILEGHWEGERYIVQSLHPSARADLEVDPAEIQAIRIGEDSVILETRGQGDHTLPAPGPIIVEPGHPIAAPVLKALRARTAPTRAATPDTGQVTSVANPELGIPEALPRRTQVGDSVVRSTQSDGDQGFVVTLLARQPDPIRVHLRPWDSSRKALSRRGPWAIDLIPEHEPSEIERRVLGALARLLPAGTLHNGDSEEPASPRPEAAPSKPAQSISGVICTAPWTTLEIVDPDGRIRQCCGDWTVGDRGNLHEQSLADAWNGSGYRMARRVMSGKDLSSLCHKICPRLYDAKFAESELSIIPGADAFVANQRMLIEDVAARREVVRAKPLYIAVCPSTYCNYDCIMCLHGRTPRRELSEDIWQELLSLLPTTRVLTLLGGEPLANPLAMKFLRSWDRAAYPDAAVSIVTNGSLLGATTLAHLERCNFANVTISLNAGTPEAYAQVQRGAPLQEVLANIDALLELRRRQGADFPVVLSYVVQPANHTTLIEFGEIARTRNLPIRLMPLSIEGVEELDFYNDEDQVARVLASLDSMAEWANESAQTYGAEIHATRSAIAEVAASRPSKSPSTEQHPTD